MTSSGKMTLNEIAKKAYQMAEVESSTNNTVASVSEEENKKDETLVSEVASLKAEFDKSHKKESRIPNNRGSRSRG